MALEKNNETFSTLLVGLESEKSKLIESTLVNHCPQLDIREKVGNIIHAQQVVERRPPNLIIIDLHVPNGSILKLLNKLALYDLEVIIIAQCKEFAYEAIKLSASGFVLKPVEPNDLIFAVRRACEKIRFKEEREINKQLIGKINKKLSEEDLIGVPTMEGFDFIRIKEIIRCKGLQRCTQIITLPKSNIISSHNLGEYKGALEPLGFFTPHKSHLINLNYIKKYRRDGSILMCDDVHIPVARRRRADFLKAVNHL